MNVVILSSYFQSAHASANGLCASSICDELRRRGHNVTVVCYKSALDEIKNEIVEIEEKNEPRYNRDRIFDRIRAYCETAKSFFKPRIDKKLVSAYERAVEDLIGKAKIDLIVAFYFPLETTVALAKIKKRHPEIKALSYELDSVGDGIIGPSSLEHKKARVSERFVEKIYRRLDWITVMRAHESFWKKTHVKHVEKLLIADIPMIKTASYEQKVSDENADGYSCIYAGLLDKSFRNPTHFLRILSEINKDGNSLQAHFYSKGNCEDILKAAEANCGYIHTHGYVAKEVLDKAGEKASAFISIGNATSSSVPSKIFSYISNGKPIIHISSQEGDVCVRYLQKYPLALILSDASSVSNSASQIKEFLKNCREKTVDAQIIKELFFENTPEFSASLFEDALK